MVAYQVVIDTATGNLLRAGYTDFENDGSFDPATETVMTTEPISEPIVDEIGNADVTQWDGTSFQVVPRNLDTIKTERILFLKLKITKYLEKRYSAPVQRSLTLFLGEANSKAYTVRASHIQQGIDWVGNVLTEYYTKRDAVGAETTVSGVAAIDLDLDALDTGDPQLTLEGARDILE